MTQLNEQPHKVVYSLQNYSSQSNMEAEEINKKIDITWAAVDLYIQNGKISIPDLVNATKLSATEIYSYFPNKKAILAFYYPALVFQYWAMIDQIDDFEAYKVSEKFSNFIFTNFDMMEEKLEFVEATFDSNAATIWGDTEYHNEITAVFKEFLNTDGNIAVSAAFFMNDFFYKALATQYLFLVKYWINDSSENKEKTLALADKLASLFEELVYNKTIDKTFDLLKFLVGSEKLDDWLPNFNWASDTNEAEVEIEINDADEEGDDENE